MSFSDDILDKEPATGGSILYRCRRCSGLVAEGPHANVEIALRRAIESAPTITHVCESGTDDSALGLADLIGTANRGGSNRTRVGQAPQEGRTS